MSHPLVANPYRGWRFLLPDLDAPEDTAGLRLTATGRIARVEGAAAVRQAVLLLLSTLPGERVMRPRYGCNLHRLVFAPNDATTAGLAIHYVREALQIWEPRIEIVHLDAGPNPSEPGRLDVVLGYRVRSTLVSDQLTYSLDLHAEPLPGGQS